MSETKRLMLMSKTSFDKHATINTLLNDEKIDISETPQNEIKEYSDKEKQLVIVDTPGLMDVCDPKAVQDKIEHYRKHDISLYKAEAQFDAIGLIFRYPVRMTPEETQAIKMCLDIVGKKKFQKYGFLVFTNGISFVKQKGGADENFKNYLQSEVDQARRQSGKRFGKGDNAHEHLGSLIRWVCNGNEDYTSTCMFIDNDESDETVLDKYREKLIYIVSQRQTKNKSRYSGKHLWDL